MHLKKSTRRFLVGTLAASSCTALAFSFGPAALGNGAPAPAAPLAKVSALDGALPAHFGLFRASGAVPTPAFREAVAQGTEKGANPTLARFVAAPALAGQVAVVPGNGWVCIYAPSPGAISGGTCAPVAEAVEGKLFLQILNPDGASTVVSLVPDDVAGASVVQADGRTVTAQAINNIAVAHVDRGSSVRVGQAVTPLAK